MKQYIRKNNPYDGIDPFGIKSQWLENNHGRWFVYLNNGIQMQRSRYVMAKKLCLKDLHLPYKINIHHIDGNIENDDFENLAIMKIGQHTILHRPSYHRKSLKYGVHPTEDLKLWKRIMNRTRYQESELVREGHKRRMNKYNLKRKEAIKNEATN